MPFLDKEKNRIYQRNWCAQKQSNKTYGMKCSNCQSENNITLGELTLCKKCLLEKNWSGRKKSLLEKIITSKKKKAKFYLRKIAGVKNLSIPDDCGLVWVMCVESIKQLKGEKNVDIQVINNEIKSAALKQVSETVIETLNLSISGEIDFMQANTRLRACKSIIQIIALERLRPTQSQAVIA